MIIGGPTEVDPVDDQALRHLDGRRVVLSLTSGHPLGPTTTGTRFDDVPAW